jgi:DNA-binding NarL/FixJ family response regulator
MARELNTTPPRTRLFLVDDEPGVRRGLRSLCGLETNLEVCGEAATEREALEGILALRPHLVIVDLSLKKGDGLGLIKQLHEHCPALKILVFSMHDQAHFATAAFAAGAHGYVVKEDGAERVLEAIQVVMQGGQYLSKQIAAKAPSLALRTRPHGRTRAP